MIFSLNLCQAVIFSFFLVVAASLLPITAGAAEMLFLADYLEQVKLANPQAEAARRNAEAEAHLVKPAGAWDDPFVSVGPDEIPLGESGGMMRYTLSQGIPFPGKSGARMRAARHRALAAAGEAETILRELAVSAATVYFQTMLAEQTIARTEEIRGILRQVAETEKARYGAGLGSHHGLLLAEIEVDLLETELLRLGRELATRKAVLNELRDAPMETAIQLPGSLPEIDDILEKFTYEEALAVQPERLALEARGQAAEEEERSARLAFYPDFMIQGMFMQSLHEEEDDAWGVMAGINVPLFLGRKQGELLAASRHRRASLHADRRAMGNRLAVAWQDILRQYQTAADVFAQYRSVVLPRTELAQDAAQSAYAANLMSVREYLDIIRVRRVLDIEMVAARLDLALAEVRLREFLSQPPMFRLAPMRPTLFGGEGMGMGTPSNGMEAGMPAVPPPSPRMPETPGRQPGMQQPGMGGM